ncbi:MAG: ATP synthase F1 subunit delta [Hespellia sp.]|nr:ATP synthase F1 subunit delta [Hespellia sp.]
MAKLVSKVYGDALFAVAKETNRIDEFYADAKGMLEVLQNNDDLNTLMDSPKIVKEEKEKIIENTFSGSVSKEIIGLMRLLVAKDHYKQMASVFEYVIALVKEEKKIGIAYISTAVELTDSQKAAIMDRLLETTKYETFEMHYETDNSLIGGIVIRVGDRVVDSSIKTKLYELSKNLKNIQLAL